MYLLHVLGEISGILPDFTLKILGALMLTPSHLTHAHFIYYVRGTRRVPIMGTRRPFGPLSPYGHPMGAHYRSRFIFFYRSSALRAPGSNGTQRVPYGCPFRAPIILYNACARVREAPKGNFGHFTRDLGLN